MRNLKKEGMSLRHIILEASHAAVTNAQIEPGDVRSGVVASFATGLFTRQLHLSAIFTELDVNCRGIPTFKRHDQRGHDPCGKLMTR